jgi:hypothetical protein
MPQRPIVLLHGCRDPVEGLRPSRAILIERRCSTADIPLCRRISLSNQLTSKALGPCVY